MSKIQVVEVDGMMCRGCVHHVEEALKKLPGVKSVEVSLEKKEAVIKSSEGLHPAIIQKAIAEAGYKFIGVK